MDAEDLRVGLRVRTRYGNGVVDNEPIDDTERWLVMLDGHERDDERWLWFAPAEMTPPSDDTRLIAQLVVDRWVHCVSDDAVMALAKRVLELEARPATSPSTPPPDTERQPPPTGDGEDVTASVCGLLNVSAELADALRRRSVEGARKYGTVLKTHNGRNAAIDCYQELLDAIVYAHQAALEHEADREAGAPLGPLRDDLISWADQLRRRL